VAYNLTPLGLSLLQHITALTHWALEHEPEITAAQATYGSERKP
jgi:DNA-binding HxlR family transcriptional regulator